MAQHYLIKSNTEQNMHRFYLTQIVPGLFGDWGLVREWGRIGQSGQCRTDWFASNAEAAAELIKITNQKAKRGYVAA